MYEVKLFEIILIVFIGIIFGCFTGVIPGVHINLISTFVFLTYINQSISINITYIIIFIISMSITHTFLDFIPNVIFGVPNSDNVLSYLPAHKLVNEGKGYLAIFLSSIGSLFGFFFSLFFLFFMIMFLNKSYELIKSFIPIILIFVIFLMIFLERGLNKKFFSFLISSLSIAYGILILNSSILISPLLVLFTGAFGIATLIDSLLFSSPSFKKQKFSKNKFKKEYLKYSFIGTFVSLFTTVSPGIGNSQAATISSIFFKNLSSKNFIIVVSAINTAGFIFSIITFYLIERARNGSIFIISQVTNNINSNEIIFYIFLSLIISIIAFFLTLKVGKFFLLKVQNLNFKIINVTILLFLFSFIFFVEGAVGIVALLGSTALGIMTINLGIKRIHLMGVLIGPIIINLI